MCTCTLALCTCMAILSPNILRVLGDLMIAIPHSPWTHQTPNTKHYIRFTHCHDVFPTTASREKTQQLAIKYDPFIQILRTKGWEVNSRITITVGVMHHPQTLTSNLRTPQTTPKWNIKWMKQMQQLAMNYLTYLILNWQQRNPCEPTIK